MVLHPGQFDSVSPPSEGLLCTGYPRLTREGPLACSPCVLHLFPSENDMARPAILFDMDGVLIDTSKSYFASIHDTVRWWLSKRSVVAPETWLSGAWLVALKERSGFNNDWVATDALLLLVLAGVEADVEVDAGLRRVIAALRLPDDASTWRSLLRARLPNAPSYDEVRETFQSSYLGVELHAKLHPEMTWVDGVSPGPRIADEHLLMDPSALSELARLVPLGIATGRPSGEAAWALHHHGLEAHFGAVVTHDDVDLEERKRGTGERLGKPSPWPLQEAARRLGAAWGDVRPLLYLGDLPDDMRAAHAAGCSGWGIVSENSSRAALEEAGAERVFDSAKEALEQVLERVRAEHSISG